MSQDRFAQIRPYNDGEVRGVLDRLQELGAASVRELHGEPESMVFALPKELRLRLVN